MGKETKIILLGISQTNTGILKQGLQEEKINAVVENTKNPKEVEQALQRFSPDVLVVNCTRFSQKHSHVLSFCQNLSTQMPVIFVVRSVEDGVA